MNNVKDDKEKEEKQDIILNLKNKLGIILLNGNFGDNNFEYNNILNIIIRY